MRDRLLGPEGRNLSKTALSPPLESRSIQTQETLACGAHQICHLRFAICAVLIGLPGGWDLANRRTKGVTGSWANMRRPPDLPFAICAVLIGLSASDQRWAIGHDARSDTRPANLSGQT